MTGKSDQSWPRVSELLDRALDLEEGERNAFLSDIAHTEPDIAAELRQLLRHAEERGDWLEESFTEVAQSISDAAVHHYEGRRIGAYRIEARVAGGGMGTVFRGRRDDGVFEQQVAIKVLRWDVRSRQLAARFAVERRAMARLSHPNVAQIIDGGVTDDDLPYLVMEWVDGETIDEYVRRHRPSLRRRLHLFVAVARAVAFAHRNLVVHRDLKPSNVI